jgi:hypothetical protein
MKIRYLSAELTALVLTTLGGWGPPGPQTMPVHRLGTLSVCSYVVGIGRPFCSVTRVTSHVPYSSSASVPMKALVGASTLGLGLTSHRPLRRHELEAAPDRTGALSPRVACDFGRRPVSAST